MGFVLVLLPLKLGTSLWHPLLEIGASINGFLNWRWRAWWMARVNSALRGAIGRLL